MAKKKKKKYVKQDLVTLLQSLQSVENLKGVKLAVAKEELPENAKLIEERKKQLDEVNELLQGEIELDLAELAEKDLPTEITGKELASIALIIK